MLAMMLNLKAAGSPPPPAWPETWIKKFYSDERATDGWSYQDLRNSSFVDTTYHKWDSYDGTSNMWKTFGTLGTSFIRMRGWAFPNVSFKISYEWPWRSIVLEAHSFTYTYSHDYTMTAKVDGVEVWSGTIPGPWDVYDPRTTVTIEHLANVNQFRFIAWSTVYHTVTDTRAFDTMRVWFNRNWNGYGFYGVDMVEWYVA